MFFGAFLVVYLLGFFNLETTQALTQWTKGMIKLLLHFLFLVCGLALVVRKGERCYWVALAVFCVGIWANALYGLVQLAYAEAYRLYQDRLRAANAVDFDDLIMVTVHLLQAFPEVRETYRRRFRHLLVDEYQDTNHAQYALIRELCGHDVGRPSVAGDYYYDSPHLLGTMRTGPDLFNIGARQPSADWQFGHLYQPRAYTPGSIMPAYPYLFEIRKQAEPGDKVVALPPQFAPAGGVVVATQAAQDLVSYLLALDRTFPALAPVAVADPASN